MAPKADIFEQVIFFWAGVGLGLESPYIDFFFRGRGIHVFNQLSQLEKIINEYSQGIEEKQPNAVKVEIEKKDFIKFNMDLDIAKNTKSDMQPSRSQVNTL